MTPSSTTRGAALALAMALMCAGFPAAAQIQAVSPGEQEQMMKRLEQQIETQRRLRAGIGRTNDKDLFVFFDENEDGLIERTEWDLRKMRIYGALDRNGDEQVSPKELPGIGADTFAEADTNGDGYLDGLEFNQAPFMQFDFALGSKGPADLEAFKLFMVGLRK